MCVTPWLCVTDAADLWQCGCQEDGAVAELRRQLRQCQVNSVSVREKNCVVVCDVRCFAVKTGMHLL
jgi:hypothetical protein